MEGKITNILDSVLLAKYNNSNFEATETLKKWKADIHIPDKEIYAEQMVAKGYSVLYQSCLHFCGDDIRYVAKAYVEFHPVLPVSIVDSIHNTSDRVIINGVTFWKSEIAKQEVMAVHSIAEKLFDDNIRIRSFNWQGMEIAYKWEHK